MEGESCLELQKDLPPRGPDVLGLTPSPGQPRAGGSRSTPAPPPIPQPEILSREMQ